MVCNDHHQFKEVHVMSRMIALMMFCLGTMSAWAQDAKDPLQVFRKAIATDDRKDYVLSFDVTYPRCKQNDVYEKLKQEYVIKVRGDERYSVITSYFKDRPANDNKKKVRQQFILPAFIIYYTPDSDYIDFYTSDLDRHVNHEHNVDYRKLGRLAIPLGASNGTPLSDYDKLFENTFSKRTINAKEIEYTASLREGKVEYTLVFKDSNFAYPAVSKCVSKDGTFTLEQMQLVKCGDDKSYPTEIDYMQRHNGELTDHQCIRNIKITPLPADFVFTPTLLNIPINAKALRDNIQEMYWDGRKFVNNRVPVGP